MRHCWLPSAAVLLYAGGAWAESPDGTPVVSPSFMQKPGGDVMPGAVISALQMPAPPAPGQPGPDGHPAAGCSTCGDGGHAHGSAWQCFRDWFCYRSYRPHECTDTPTLYRPPLYMYFRCQGCNLQPRWPVDRCDPRLFQLGLPPDFPPPANGPPPAVAAPAEQRPGAGNSSATGTTAPEPIQPSTPPPPPKNPLETPRVSGADGPRTQGPLLPGSASASALGACGTCSDPGSTLKYASPYGVTQVGARDSTAPGFRPIPVFVPAFGNKTDRR